VPKLFPNVGAGYVPNFRYGGIANQTFPFTDFNGLPFINQNHTFNFIDNVSKIIGTHTIKAGFYAQRSRKDQTSFARTDGDINFTTIRTTRSIPAIPTAMLFSVSTTAISRRAIS
jgi:hypothetical protein